MAEPNNVRLIGHVLLSKLVKPIKEENTPIDSKIPCALKDRTPPSVEDKTEKQEGVSKARDSKDKISTPVGGRNQSKRGAKHVSLTNMIPVEVKRAKDSEIPEVSGKFDEDMLNYEEVADIYNDIDSDIKEKKHFTTLKEAIFGEDEDAAERERLRPHLDNPESPYHHQARRAFYRDPKEDPEIYPPGHDARKMAQKEFFKPINSYGVLDGESDSKGVMGASPDGSYGIKEPEDTMEAKKPKLGSGGRFKQLVKKLAAREGVELDEAMFDAVMNEDAAALAAWIGRKKYGKNKYQKMAAAGRKRHNKESSLMEKKPKLGSGERFKQLVRKLAAKENITINEEKLNLLSEAAVRNPKALAAWIGRKKYGSKKMAKMSAAGRKHKDEANVTELSPQKYKDAAAGRRAQADKLNHPEEPIDIDTHMKNMKTAAAANRQATATDFHAKNQADKKAERDRIARRKAVKPPSQLFKNKVAKQNG